MWQGTCLSTRKAQKRAHWCLLDVLRRIHTQEKQPWLDPDSNRAAPTFPGPYCFPPAVFRFSSALALQVDLSSSHGSPPTWPGIWQVGWQGPQTSPQRIQALGKGWGGMLTGMAGHTHYASSDRPAVREGKGLAQ
jgi:hypothetical protein